MTKLPRSSWRPEPSRYAAGNSRAALYFFVIALTSLLCAGFLTSGLVAIFPQRIARPAFPRAFLFSTSLLLTGSVSLQLAVRSVRREHQREFRFWLVTALALGAMFVGVQSFGLWSMLPLRRGPEDASLGSRAFIVSLASLHALHFFVAVLFVCLILSRTTQDRYDHESYWGVALCAWFWHALGIVWLVILGVLLIAL